MVSVVPSLWNLDLQSFSQWYPFWHRGQGVFGGLVLVCIFMACCPRLTGHCWQKYPIWPQEIHFLIVESFPLGLILFFFFLSCVRPPWGGFLQGAGSVYCACFCFKSSFVSKTFFTFLSLRQYSGRLWGQSGKLLGPGRRKQRWQRSPWIRKWWINF